MRNGVAHASGKNRHYYFFQAWFLVFFVGMGLIVPQLSPYVYRELSLEEPGLLFLCAQFVFPVGALLAGYLSDRTLYTRAIIFQLSVVSAVAIFLFAHFHVAWAIESEIIYAGLWSLFAFAIGGVIPLMNVSYLQSDNERDHFGRVRMYGTIGFLLPNAALLFTEVAPSQLIRIASVFFLASTLLLFWLPNKRRISDSAAKQRISLQHIRQLLQKPSFVIFLGIMFLFFICFAPAEYIVSDYIKPVEMGVQPVQLAWFLGTSLEIVFFLISPLLVRRFSSLWIITFSFAAAIIRFAGLVLLPLAAPVVVLQILHGLHFSPAYLGAVLHIEESVNPAHLATAQALYTTMARAAGTGVGAYYLGNLAGAGQYDLAFGLAGAAAVLGLLALSLFARLSGRKSA